MTRAEVYELLNLNMSGITMEGNAKDLARFLEALAYAQDVILKTEKLDPNVELPKDEDVFVIVCVSGVSGGVRLDRAIELATYNREDGWCLEWCHDNDKIEVHWWMDLPEDKERQLPDKPPCESCRRIENPAKDIFIRSHAPGTQEEYRTDAKARFCPVCGREIVRRDVSEEEYRRHYMGEWVKKENES